ncbi:Regulatory LuxR family protein [Vibrio chagasii]|nr:Regulatory LuxR family protein [Vibrio chagasii]CAH7397964.1 Regulatory LuxR family protein [Vibrio chagasii]
MSMSVISNDVFLEAVKHKFEINDYPIAIVNPDLEYLYLSVGYKRVMSLSPSGGDVLSFNDLPKSLVDLYPIFEEQVRNTLLQMKALSFLDIIIVEGKKLVYYKKLCPVIAPSGDVLGVEIHLISMAAVIGAIHVLNRAAWYSPDDSSVTDVQPALNHTVLTSRQETYLFFVMQGFSNVEIADCLNVSTSTVENTIRTITRKLSDKLSQPIKNRSDLKRRGFSLGYGYVLPRDILKPHSIPLQYSLDDWMYLNFG